MTKLISARLPDPTADRVRRYAQRKQRSVNETVSIALEEWLRQNEFAYVEFRDTPDGRMAYMKNSRLPIYWVVRTAKAYDMDVGRVSAHWPNRPRAWIQAALHYYEAYPAEIEAQIALHESGSSFERLKRALPQIEAYPLPPQVLKGE